MKERARTILAGVERESEKDSKAMTPTTPRYKCGSGFGTSRRRGRGR